MKSIKHRLLKFIPTFTPQSCTIFWVVIFLMITANVTLFKKITELYPLNLGNLPFLVSLATFFTITSYMFLLMVCHGRWTRWVLALVLLLASQAAYYMDQFGVIIDTVMIDNIMQTNMQEFKGLLSHSLVFRTLLLGILPAWLIIKYCPKPQTLGVELHSKLWLFGVLCLLMIMVILPFTPGYFSFWREHKITRLYANPTYFSYSAFNYGAEYFSSNAITSLEKVAADAKNIGPKNQHQLVIMVVGETARADRFSLNGYYRMTNPELTKQNVISLTNVASCGTSTAFSVPCMFSVLTRKQFDKEKAMHMENALDVLAQQGVEVLWRDNNSDSKGVALRVKYEDYKSPTLNTVCEGECRDVGMLVGLDKLIAAKKDQDILIVLHQMGNHGPEYYRRYPKEFERFKPMCMTGELRDCTKEEIDNSYDNAILYTDYFLSQVIEFLEKYDNQYATAMLYVADHGESLGEHGIYLHAAPYAIAPKEQTHVPAIIWFGEHFNYSLDQLKPYQDAALSHDDVFCTLLVAFELQTKTCDSKNAMLMANKHLKDMTLR